MDTEQQIRLNFLDEAEEYFNLMESNLLGLADTAIDPQKVDLVLRAAHSIKGGAAMMSLNALSQVAHRLEDFFKILRVRYADKTVIVEIETLLLQSVDYLRNLASLNRQELSTDASEVINQQLELLSDRTQTIFTQLRSHLGDLRATDENALLSQNEDFDPAVLIFEEGVDGVLDRFESQLSALSLSELAQELSATAEELIGFGNMANLDAFIQLCESIQQQAASIADSAIVSLAEQALKTWRRSHALVLRGSIDRLPSSLETGTQDFNSTINFELARQEFLDNTAIAQDFDSLALDTQELDGLQSAFASVSINDADLSWEEDPELGEIHSAFELNESAEQEDFIPLDLESLNLTGLQSAFDLPELEETITLTSAETTANTSSSLLLESPSLPQVEKMVRVPVSQLQQFNTLFEQLVLNRNSIGLRLEQLENVVALMSQRMLQMERSNTQLKQWYDRASVEGLLSEQEQLVTAVNLGNNQQDSFDSLEMDRYSDIHLICQEQLETIVQLQEVATDVSLGVQEVNQSVQDLYYTTKSMQGNVTRTQMLPFTEAVKRFPRVIRDLNLQFNKKVDLKILGEKTLLDRSVIEALSDPLMHLLRNSFDHGIEDTQTRIIAGKPESGTITIQANNLGTYSIITLSDDGGGISLDKIRDRVCQMGLTQAEVAQISTTELLDFIFEPGFSTAAKVTELSGRGVGMDVVRSNLREIRGDVRVNTEPGKGTTFILRIPFTLSILRVAIVEQKEFIFAIPADSIRELIAVDPELMLASDKEQHVAWNQTEIPLIEIEKVLPYHAARHTVGLAGNPVINRTMTLVVGNNNSFAALKLSRFWNEQESTIRTIDSPIPLPSGIISSVIIGDGKVIPLIDPLALVAENLGDRLNDQSGLNQEISHLAIKTILIVDDSINVRRYLSLTLEKAGYRVEQAKDGREALDKLLAGLLVQAVICDVEMPRLDGYGVLEEIKERPELSNLPIAMLTSRSNEKHRKLAFNLGAAAYFSKPYNEQELLEKLSEIIN
ncbi:hybrid sensor histidine kinase/response regulator [Pleurocapsa sp. CCALA 161]|uniref:hybrid sensor histidine kinase/response regulator n=1 Tax=Pleurocapsa sp. CCALA 161 TaxID=2107688 RepID=UPI000D055A0A|nr:hybrid sensor histidine kinase/response regulator [Pleurocapsa sp. CCALA 161]PSB09760.1 hybrid sensor histidine kinase/response regulator [Pleurocapsa sp. CCALA 161]